MGHLSNSKKETVTPATVFEETHSKLIAQYGENYCIILFKKSEKEKYSSIINKFIEVESHKNVEELSQQI